MGLKQGKETQEKKKKTVFWPGEFHGHKESDTTDFTSLKRL